MEAAVICDYCETQDAQAEVVLTDGFCACVCLLCIEDWIRDHASTENPVHSMEQIDA